MVVRADQGADNVAQVIVVQVGTLSPTTPALPFDGRKFDPCRRGSQVRNVQLNSSCLLPTMCCELPFQPHFRFVSDSHFRPRPALRRSSLILKTAVRAGRTWSRKLRRFTTDNRFNQVRIIAQPMFSRTKRTPRTTSQLSVFRTG